MLEFKDFVPELLETGKFFSHAEYETFGSAVRRAGDWMSQPMINVVNVETVVLPNIHDRYENGSADISLRTKGDASSTWHQIVRVWYQTE